MVLNWAYAHKESNFQRSCSSILFEKFTSLTPLCTWNMNEAKVSQNIYVRLRWTGLLTQRILLKHKVPKIMLPSSKLLKNRYPRFLIRSTTTYILTYYFCAFLFQSTMQLNVPLPFVLPRKVKDLAVNQKAHNYQKKLYLRAMIF